MAHLYINSKGLPVRSHSYSGGSFFRECAQKYKLARIDGWKEREERASKEFGKAIETAIQEYHTVKNLDAALRAFNTIWEAQKDAGLSYTATEQNWESLSLSGQEMIRLYHLRVPLFPVDLSVPISFQVKYWKELFPGTDLSGIEFVAYIDMVARGKNGSPLIVDIKTSGAALDLTPGMLALDQQLCSYAWVTGVSEVGFLWFKKSGRSLEKGSAVAVLENSLGPVEFFAGQNAVVAGTEKDDFTDVVYLVADEQKIEEMNQAQGYKDGRLEQTKVAKERRQEWLAKNAARVPASTVTKQRVQFVNATIGKEAQLETATQIGQDVAQIVFSNTENFWPKQGGVRWPNDKCVRCEMRGICLDNAALRDQLITRIDDTFSVEKDADVW